MHQDMVVDEATSKPDIILFYSQTKGGVDTCDQMVKSMTVKRKTNRWPLAVFYRIVDFACLNSFIVWRTVKTKENVTRRQYILHLALRLSKQRIVRRSVIPQLSNDVKEAIRMCGVNVPSAHVANLTQKTKKHRCHLCPRSLEKKTTLRSSAISAIVPFARSTTVN